MSISKEDKLAQLAEEKKQIEADFQNLNSGITRCKERYQVLSGEENAVKATADGTQFEEPNA
tara:strand:- start:245 stop:430 length:186 start_codon:yes stop_codon:yes gene_type:complete